VTTNAGKHLVRSTANWCDRRHYAGSRTDGLGCTTRRGYLVGGARPVRADARRPRVTVASLRTNKTIEKPCQAPRDAARRQPAPYLDCETTHHTARRVA
jgi:hypothetical protein